MLRTRTVRHRRIALFMIMLSTCLEPALCGCQQDTPNPAKNPAETLSPAPGKPTIPAETQPETISGNIAGDYTGSRSCRGCHQRFYDLWAPSHHGLAMQPYTPELAQRSLALQKNEIIIGDFRYRAEIQPDQGWVLEQGPNGEKRYPILHALGGKNVYYLLTSMERGRLQTLPVAYDVRKKEWFDTAGSGVRHFPGSTEDEPIHWKEWPYTFNTACHSCHVSQLSTNYDLKTDTYDTSWAEPGINCETCHGPGEEHIRVCRDAGKGEIPKDLKTDVITPEHGYSIEQTNAACAVCHTKGGPITSAFPPGGRYFDHYDLTALEHRDFYPDGRDLGENYTYTLWLMSPCVKSGRLSCLHCHTSSGRFRQKDDPDQACMPCHEERIENALAHTHHPTESPGSRCISCHMPMTEFARMRRSDHSMRPPTPAATIAFHSPNACNICHKDQDAAWADALLRKWHKEDFQAPVLHWASLIEAARNSNWQALPAILAYLKGADQDAVVTASLIRLLVSCEDKTLGPAIRQLIKYPSPLVRSAVISFFSTRLASEIITVLIDATGDDYRLVRVHAAMALSPFLRSLIEQAKGDRLQHLKRANQEYLNSLTSRPDQWTSHYNLGNYHLNQGDYTRSLIAYQNAIRLEPRNAMPLVNASIVYARMGQQIKAAEALERALSIEPDNDATHFNLGLLKAEQQDSFGAEGHFRKALEVNPRMAEASFNLGLLLVSSQRDEGITLLEKAFTLRPIPKYGYSLAFYERKEGNLERAAEILKQVIDQSPFYGDAYLLLGDIHEQAGRVIEAGKLYQKALILKGLSPAYRNSLASRLRNLKSQENDRVEQ